MTDFDDYLKRLKHELRKLEGTETPIARRNARKRVLGSMRLLRGAVDKGFPPIVDRTGVVRLKTFAGRRARLTKAGWVERDSVDAGRYAVLGVRVKHLWHVDDGDEARGRPGTYIEAWFVPRWAAAIGLDRARLREAKKSRKIREAAIVAQALGQS